MCIRDSYSGVPIIMVTAVDDVDLLTDAFAAGANDYITKPINRGDLLARIGTGIQARAHVIQVL